ncbi:MAG: hypothetical protein RLZZ282_1834 [Verrucomicrobiota bacterium]
MREIPKPQAVVREELGRARLPDGDARRAEPVPHRKKKAAPPGWGSGVNDVRCLSVDQGVGTSEMVLRIREAI